MKKITILLALIFVVSMSYMNAQNDRAIIKKTYEMQRQSTSTDLLPSPSMLDADRAVTSDMYYGYGSQTTFYKSTIATFPTSTLLGPANLNVQAAEYINGKLYGVTYEGTQNRFGTISMTTGAYTNIKAQFPNDAVSLCYNPANKLTYVFAWGEGSTSPFGTVDLETGNYTPIGSVPGVLYVAIDNYGDCYSIPLKTSGAINFGKINLSTGAVTPIKAIPFNTNYVQGMSIDRETNKLYWMAYNYNAKTYHFYEIDKETGNLTALGAPTFTGNVSAFAIATEPGNIFCDPVSSLTASTSGNVVVLNWEAAPGNPTGYRITYDGTVIAPSITETTYTHTGVPDKLHTYAVAALYSDGCIPTDVTKQVMVGDYCMIKIDMQVVEAYDPSVPEVTTWGWDGSYIEITSNGTPYGAPTVPHASLVATEYVIVPSGNISFKWINGDDAGSGYGDFDDEVTFQIYNSDDELIFKCELGEAENWDSYQEFFTYKNECGVVITCSPVTATATQEGSNINVSWTAPVENGTINVWRNNAKIASSVSGTSYVDENPIIGDNCYKIELICDNGFSFSNESCVNFVGIKETVKTGFSIVPNPAKDNIKITAQSIFNKVEIVNFLGQTVLSQNNDGVEANVNVSNLTGGIYFVRIISDNGTSVQKFVKQ